MRFNGPLFCVVFALASLCRADSFTYILTQDLPPFSYDSPKIGPQPQFVWTATTSAPVPFSFDPEPGYLIPFSNSGLVINGDARTDLWSPEVPMVWMPDAVDFGAIVGASSPWIDPVLGPQSNGIIETQTGGSCTVAGQVTSCTTGTPDLYMAFPHVEGHFDPGYGWGPETLQVIHNTGCDPVPEPAAWALVGLGGLGLITLRRPKRLE